jgi:hypothetical protein
VPALLVTALAFLAAPLAHADPSAPTDLWAPADPSAHTETETELPEFAPPKPAPVRPPEKAPLDEERDRDRARRKLDSLTTRHRYMNWLGSLTLGRGLRFNNPYRLSTELGATGESLSLTAPYLDLSAGVTFGKPDGLQHGARLSYSIALRGVPQQVITPAYFASKRASPSWLLYGWAGLPFLVQPDFNMGGELGLGVAWWVRAGVGVTAALIGDGFYGAATYEVPAAFYPVLSGQLGLIFRYEVLP